MRYERVQDILQNDNLLRTKLSARTQAVVTRFGEKLMFSKETVEVTEAIHAEGKDAHKVPKHEVLRMALRVMKVLPSNGEVSAIGAKPPTPLAPSVPVPTASTTAEKIKPKSKVTPGTKAPTAASSATIKPKKTQPVRAVAKPQPARTENKAAKPVRVVRSTKDSKGGTSKELPAVTKPAVRPAATEQDENQVPESELPPERQPLHLPVAFDPRRYPHYNVQSSIYSMLLSALNLSEHFEKYAGFEERQRKLELVIKEYLETCDAIKNGA